MIIIKRWTDGSVLFEFNESNGYKDGMTIRHAVEAAVAFGANLSDADFRGADLYCANLLDENLRGADLRFAKF